MADPNGLDLETVPAGDVYQRVTRLETRQENLATRVDIADLKSAVEQRQLGDVRIDLVR